MNERQWLACGKPDKMLEFVKGQVSERKLRLFALACCARIDHLITDPRSRAALEFAEKHVEAGVTRRKGRASLAKAAHAAWKEAYARLFTVGTEDRAGCLVVSCAADAAEATLHVDPWFAASYASSFATFAVGWGLVKASGSQPELKEDHKRAEWKEQARLLRDVLGNPVRPVAVDLPALAPAGSAGVELARGIYDERAFDRLPIWRRQAAPTRRCCDTAARGSLMCAVAGWWT
jgi:hypothetical protein